MQVVELPADVAVRIPVGLRAHRRERLGRQVPRQAVGPRGRPPALLVHPARAEHLEVLRRVPLGRLRLVERVEEARPVHRLLVDAVHLLGLGDAGGLEHGRPDVDDVRELRAHLGARLQARRPCHDHRVAGAAEVRRVLLAPLERRVQRVRPRGRAVRRGVRAAERLEAAVLLDQLGLLLGVEHEPVEERQLVERAGRRALHARAVVAPDVEDERVVEVAELLDRVEQAPDVPVGVLLVAAVDLHLPGVERLRGVVEVVPGRQLVRPRRQLGVRRDDPELLLALRGSARAARPSRRRTGPCTCRPSRSRRGAGRARSRSSRT